MPAKEMYICLLALDDRFLPEQNVKVYTAIRWVPSNKDF